MKAENLTPAMYAVLVERERQDKKWGEQNHDPFHYLTILMEEVGELAQAALHRRHGGSASGRLREEAIHTAAVALAIIECLDRGAWSWGNHALPAPPAQTQALAKPVEHRIGCLCNSTGPFEKGPCTCGAQAEREQAPAKPSASWDDDPVMGPAIREAYGDAAEQADGVKPEDYEGKPGETPSEPRYVCRGCGTIVTHRVPNKQSQSGWNHMDGEGYECGPVEPVKGESDA